MPTVSHKAYARQLATNGDIMSGNVVSNCQYSSFLSAEQIGSHQFSDYVPLWFRDVVRNKARVYGLINYYVFRHVPRGKKRPTIHGFMITANHDNTVLLRTFMPREKSREIVDYAADKIWRHAVWYNAVRARHAYARTMAAVQS